MMKLRSAAFLVLLTAPVVLGCGLSLVDFPLETDETDSTSTSTDSTSTSTDSTSTDSTSTSTDSTTDSTTSETTTSTSTGEAPVPLGSASTFAILAFDTVTNVNNPGTIVTGDLGISPGAALVGFPPGEVVGVQHLGDAVAAAAKVDLLAAYNDAVARLGAAVLPGDLSGLTLTPGLYKTETSTQLSAGNFTLDAQGDENAVFVFQVGSTFTSSPGTQMVLGGGAKASNVFWAIGTSATLGTNTISKGTFLASAAITMNTGAVLEGRLLAQGAAVSVDTNLITLPSP